MALPGLGRWQAGGRAAFAIGLLLWLVAFVAMFLHHAMWRDELQAWQIAVARDPAFAEAWYNLAMAAEDEQHNDLAIAEYRRAIQARPDYADAYFNLALLLTKLDDCEEALVVWEQFLTLEPKSKQATIAKRAAVLCRMQIMQKQTKAS